MLPIRDASPSFKLCWDYLIPGSGVYADLFHCVEKDLDIGMDILAPISMMLCMIVLLIVRSLQRRSFQSGLVTLETRTRIALVLLTAYTDIVLLADLLGGRIDQAEMDNTDSPFPDLARLLMLMPLSTTRIQYLLLFPLTFQNTNWVLGYTTAFLPRNRASILLEWYTFISYVVNRMALLYASITFSLYPILGLLLRYGWPELQEFLYWTVSESVHIVTCAMAFCVSWVVGPSPSFKFTKEQFEGFEAFEASEKLT